MRSLKSRLLALGLASFVGTLVVVGCSADGGTVGLDSDATPTDPPAATLPPSVDAGYTGSKDAGKKDSGPKAEAGVDAGPPPPVEGTTCSTPDVTASKACGACGTTQTLCVAGGDDSGTATWGPYGTCENEKVGGCIPDTTQACGNCGTQTCSKYCTWGACTGEPVGACPAGTVDYTTASCTVANTYRARTCSPTCAWGNYAATCSAANTPNKMTISATVGSVVTAPWTLAGDTLRPFGCPGTVSASSDDGPYSVVEVTNPSATKAAQVTIYQSKTTTGIANLDMVMWTYAGSDLPMNNTALGACVDGVADDCTGDETANPCGNTGDNFYFAGIAAVAIPAGGKILVYSSLYDGLDDDGDGTFNLNIKTTQLQ
jgi:hypothetical protein